MIAWLSSKFNPNRNPTFFFPKFCIPKFLNKTFQRKFGEKFHHLFRQPSFAFDSKVESPASELGENTITDSSPDGNTKNPGVKCGVLVVSQKIGTWKHIVLSSSKQPIFEFFGWKKESETISTIFTKKNKGFSKRQSFNPEGLRRSLNSSQQKNEMPRPLFQDFFYLISSI